MATARLLVVWIGYTLVNWLNLCRLPFQLLPLPPFSAYERALLRGRPEGAKEPQRATQKRINVFSEPQFLVLELELDSVCVSVLKISVRWIGRVFGVSSLYYRTQTTLDTWKFLSITLPSIHIPTQLASKETTPEIHNDGEGERRSMQPLSGYDKVVSGLV